MLIAVYLAGVLAVGFFVVCCGFARNGEEWAKAVSWVEVWVLLGLASFCVLLGFAVMLAGGRESADSWWSQGLGQQFLTAVFGWLVLAVAGLSVRQGLYQSAAMFMVAAAVLFGLWGLLVDAGWSSQGPLAFV